VEDSTRLGTSRLRATLVRRHWSVVRSMKRHNLPLRTTDHGLRTPIVIRLITARQSTLLDQNLGEIAKDLFDGFVVQFSCSVRVAAAHAQILGQHDQDGCFGA
jgi:hypothetical protein